MALDDERGPLGVLRGGLGISRTEFAVVLGVSYDSAYQAEAGRKKLSAAAQEALREIGADVEDLLQRQAEWVEERGRRLRAELAGKAPDGTTGSVSADG